MASSLRGNARWRRDHPITDATRLSELLSPRASDYLWVTVVNDPEQTKDDRKSTAGAPVLKPRLSPESRGFQSPFTGDEGEAVNPGLGDVETLVATLKELLLTAPALFYVAGLLRSRPVFGRIGQGDIFTRANSECLVGVGASLLAGTVWTMLMAGLEPTIRADALGPIAHDIAEAATQLALAALGLALLMVSHARGRPTGGGSRWLRLMPIVVTLDVMLVRRKVKGHELCTQVGISETQLSLLRSGKGRGLRFNTFAKMCAALDCKPGDLLDYQFDPADFEEPAADD